MPKKTVRKAAGKHAPSKPEYDVIAIGDATLDHFMEISDVTVDCAHRSGKSGVCMLCFRHADKIAVEKLTKVIGGNAANHAVGASRMGFKSAYFTILGSDDTGMRIHEMLKAEKVSTSLVKHAKGEETNFSVVLNHDSERTILVYHAHRNYVLPTLKRSRWIYYTSSGPGHEIMNEPVAEHVRRYGIRLGYNPGTFQLKSGTGEMTKIIEVAEIVFINKEEAQTIVGDFNSFKRLLKELHKMGARIPVITDGPEGAYTYDGKSFLHIGTTPTKVIERTGAGDSFAVGVVSAMMAKQDLPTALRWGTMNSASVIQFIGPQEGLLTRAKMRAWLERYKALKAKPF